MGTRFYLTLFLVVTLVSLSSCLDKFYTFAPKLINKKHISVVPEGKSSYWASGTAPGDEEGSVSNSMIVNGWEVEDAKFPFMASIQILEQKYKRYHICGAIIISTNKALTSAHCLDYWGGIEYFVAVGFNRLSQHGQALVRISEVEIHPKYKPHKEGFPNDLAIVTFEEHVTISDRVQIANLSSPSDPDHSGQYCYVAGWGLTEDSYKYPDELRFVALYSLNNGQCKKFLKIFRTPRLVRNHHTCAWLWPYSACYGDSGGPLVCGDKVVGILSWAPDCEGCFPLIFARVSSFWNWIQNHI